MRLSTSVLLLLLGGIGAIPAEEPSQPPVVGVVVKGLRQIPEETVRKIISAEVGKPVSPTLMDRDFMALWKYGSSDEKPPRFIDVSIRTIPVEDGILLEYNLKERPRVSQVVWNYEPEKGHYLKPRHYPAANSLVKRLYDEGKVKQAIEEIRTRYLNAGYVGTRVEWKVAPAEGEDPDYPSRVVLDISITEGERYVVERLFFEGMTAITTREAWAQIEKDPVFKEVVVGGTERAGWWEYRWEIARYYESFFRSKGFLDARVEPSGLVPLEPGSVKHKLVFRVDEGPRYRLDEMSIEGNETVSDDELLSIAMKTLNETMGEDIYLVKDKHGRRISGRYAYYSNQVAKHISERLRVRYREDGRVFTNVSVQPGFKEDHLVNITLHVEEDVVRKVNRIEPRGNEVTHDRVIRREFALKPGQEYDEDLMTRTVLNLYNLDLFESINPRPFPVGEDKVDIMFDVREGPKGSIQAALTYGDPMGVVGQFSLKFKNFDITNPPRFLGGGQKLSIDYMAGSTYDEKSFSFTEPYLGGKPLSLTIDAYDRGKSYGRPWFEREQGFRLGLTWRKSLALFERRFLNVGTSLSYYDVRLQDIASTVPSDSPIRDFEGRWTHAVLGLSFTYDAIDSPVVPTKGYRLKLYNNIHASVLGGEWSYFRYGMNIDGYVPLSGSGPREKRPVLSLRLHMGGVEPFGDTDKVPVYDRFYAGGEWGEWMVRGYELRTLSPRYPVPDGDSIGGGFAVAGSAELMFPIVPKTMLGVMFLDAGNAWAAPGDFSLEEVRTSAGFGIRFTPYGFPFPIGLYWAWPLNAQPQDELASRFILTLGIFY